jgi:hypothetical protein
MRCTLKTTIFVLEFHLPVDCNMQASVSGRTSTNAGTSLESLGSLKPRRENSYPTTHNNGCNYEELKDQPYCTTTRLRRRTRPLLWFRNARKSTLLRKVIICRYWILILVRGLANGGNICQPGSRSSRQNLLGGPGAFKSASCQHLLGSVYGIHTFIEFAGKSRCHGLLQCDLEYHIIPQASMSKPLSREINPLLFYDLSDSGWAYHTSPDRFSHHPKC